MIVCQICGENLKNKRSLAAHFRYNHGSVTFEEYKRQFVYNRCEMCQDVLSKKGRNITGLCKKCHDSNRYGERNPFFGKKHTDHTKNMIKEKNRLISTALWTNEEYRGKVIKGVSKPRTESFKMEQSIRITQWYKDNPEQLNIRSELLKKAWETGRITPHENVVSYSTSKEELELFNRCEVLFGEQRVHKSTLKLGGRWYFPDIIINDSHIIEYFGDYWHGKVEEGSEEYMIKNICMSSEKREQDKKRIDIFVNHGYEVLIVWASDYKKDKDLMMVNILNWYNNSIRPNFKFSV